MAIGRKIACVQLRIAQRWLPKKGISGRGHMKATALFVAIALGAWMTVAEARRRHYYGGGPQPTTFLGNFCGGCRSSPPGRSYRGPLGRFVGRKNRKTV